MGQDAEAEAAALEAQKKALDARHALEVAQDPSKKATDDKLAAAKAAKDLADAQKASADAQKSQSDAQLAAFKAAVGDVPSSGYSGSVDLKDKAGSTEAALLAGKSVVEAAKKVAESLPKQGPRRTVFLYAMNDVPNFQALIAFRAQVALVKKAFADAQVTSDAADKSAPEPVGFRLEAVPILGAAGLGLDAVNKLLGFFRTDYTVGGVDLSFDDSLLLHALAGVIANSDKNLEVRLPAAYNADALSDAASGILAEFNTLSFLKIGGQDNANRQDKLAARFSDDAAKETDAAKKADLLNKSKAHKNASDAWKAAAALYDSFFSKLTTADDKGVAPLTTVIRDAVIADSLSKGNLLLISKLQKSGGAYYTKKNMWTFFGGMPLYHMGGVVVSYVSLSGTDGHVLSSGVVPIHGGFVKASKLAKYLEIAPAPKADAAKALNESNSQSQSQPSKR